MDGFTGGTAPVAIIGMGFRFPGDNNTPEDFARFLRQGRSGITEVPEGRLDGGAPPAELGGIRGGFLDRIDGFDANFFTISPREAECVDPQQRLVLVTAWEALEDANIDPATLRNRNGGVYVGAGTMDHALALADLPHAERNAYLGTGTALSAVAGRVSYFFGLRGPSLSVDTACSASLAAIHLAAQALRAGECEIALCGGVNVIHTSMGHSVFQAAGMLAADGQCKTFDERADGYARSEGCGMVVLKLASDAQRDGDTIHALIRGSAIRQDGESAGLTVPNGLAQEAVMRAALANAGLASQDIQYVEAHGTGTSLGDPIDLGSIADLFAESHSHDRPVLVGSLKTNLGHMECAAGVGGLVKTVLQLRSATIYPHLNLNTPSTRIPWHTLPVAVPTACRPWPAGTRRALVNSYGFAGTLVSVVLEQAPELPARPRGADRGVQVFTLSAKSRTSLEAQLDGYLRHLAERPEVDLGDLCYTANVGRSHLPLRLATAVSDRDELVRRLHSRKAGSGPARTGFRRAVFLFAGQGTQYTGMGAALYQHFPVFSEHLDECDRLLADLPGGSVRELLLADPAKAAATDPIHQTRFTQPALFAFEYALARLWMSWGVRPSALIGHSVGELTAAAVAEVFDLADAAAVVAERGRLMQVSSTAGRMAAISLPAEEAAELIRDHPGLSLAAINSPRHCVLSGEETALAGVVDQLLDRGVEAKYLATSNAFHSPLMADAATAFHEVVAGIRCREPKLPIVATLTGEIARRGELTNPEYWARQLRETVRFADSVAAVARRGKHVFIEIGPSAALTGLARQCAPATEHRWLTSQRRGDLRQRAIHDAVADLYEAGMPVNWAAYHRGHERRKVDLPRYRFDERRYWLASNGWAAGAGTHRSAHPLLGTEVTTEDQRATGVREFAAVLGTDQPDYLADHVVSGRATFPGAGYVELLLAAQEAVFGQTNRPVRQLRIHEALFLPAEGGVRIRTRLTEWPDGTTQVEVVGQADDGERLIERQHATAYLGAASDVALSPSAAGEWLRDQAGRAGQPDEEWRADELYEAFSALGIDYGTRFRRVRRLARHGDFAVGEIQGVDAPGTESLPPAVLDAALHALAAFSDQRCYLPVEFGELRLFRKPRAARLTSVVRAGTASPDDDPRADLILLDDGGPVLELRGLALKEITTNAGRPAMSYQPCWTKRALTGHPGKVPKVLVLHHETRPVELAEAIGAAGGTVAAASCADYADALAEHRPTDVCWFWRYTEADGVTGIRRECEDNYRDLLHLLDVLERNGRGHDRRRLWLITRASQHLPGDPPASPSRLAAATIWGFARSLSNECPGHQVTTVDLPPGGDETALAGELLNAPATEFQIAYRAGYRHVRRLRPKAVEEDRNIELAITRYGAFSGIQPVPVPDRPPVGDEIEVRVSAAGLNFKDVLNALGMLKQHAVDTGRAYQAMPLGFECAGTVIAAGPNARFCVGDEVIVTALGCLRRRITVSSAMAVRKPARVDFVAAAGLPVVFTTAHYALHTLGRIRRGERVLVHAGAGGVGQAAIRLATLAGAEVFATASPAKWPLLREQGVRHVMNSRTLDFAAEIAEITGGQGVDVVLNSLNKDFIAASMSCLGEGGRFIEMGKVGAWTPEQARAHRPDVDYRLFDLSELPENATGALSRRLLETVAELLDAGVLDPVPTTAYRIDEVDEAFGVLSRGANIGKLVISFDDRAVPPVRPAVIDGEHTYLIAGGLGGLGMLTAHKLVDLGARHLALLSRSGTPTPDVVEALDRLTERAKVTVLCGDVAEPGDVRRVLETLAHRLPPIGGIVHAGGVLADLPTSTMDWPAIDRVLRPKVYGGWLLHEAANGLPELSFFAGYSSVSAILGQPGQANYAAGNAFLDNLMRSRAAAGQPGLSVNWGPVAEVGMTARLADRHRRGLEDRGVRLLRPRQAMRELAAALRRGEPQVMVGECDWARFSAARPLADALYQHLVPAGDAVEQVDLAELLAAPRAARTEFISGFVCAKVGEVLRRDEADELDSDTVFAELGLDSLMAVEFKNALETAFRVSLPASVAFDHPSVGQLAAFIDNQLEPERGTAYAAPPSRQRHPDQAHRATAATAGRHLPRP